MASSFLSDKFCCVFSQRFSHLKASPVCCPLWCLGSVLWSVLRLYIEKARECFNVVVVSCSL